MTDPATAPRPTSEPARRAPTRLRQVLDFGPTVVFLALYFLLKDGTYTVLGRETTGFVLATLIFIPILLASILAVWIIERRLSRIQIFTMVMVLVFGGLTAWFNDGDFFKMKTTIVYGLFAGLLTTGLMLGRSWLEWIMGEFLAMRHEGWMILTRRLTAFFAALAVANEVLWRTAPEWIWVVVETFAFPALTFGFLFWQITTLQQYLIDPEADPATDPGTGG